MKPKRIELEGFTAYRKRTEIDFEEADLFVIVGATGSGKSSIIDAMIFALYGSVPRFDDQKLVQPVISQGKNEARVCCRFTLDEKDYSVTRVVRRIASDPGKASTKEARLESNGEVIASGAPEVTQAVIERIGLTFDQFTRCVVLPQGAFARFLHDKPKARQDLLNQLLGLGLYERLATRAKSRAAEAKTQAGVYESRIAALPRLTDDDEREADARANAVADLAVAFRRERPEIEALAREAAKLGSDADADDADRALLAGVAVPPEVVRLADRRAALGEKRSRVRASIEEIENTLKSAGRRRDALGDLARLVEWQGRFKQLADTRDRLGGQETELRRSTEAAGRTRAAFEAAAARRGGLGALEPLVELQGLLQQLGGTRERLKTATGDRTRAKQELDAASDRLDSAQHDLKKAGDLDALIHERGLLLQLQAAREERRKAQTDLDRRKRKAEEATAALRRAERDEDEGRRFRDRLRAEQYAHELRMGLRPGDSCPVCEQEVAAPPAGDPPRGLDEADRALAVAASSRTRAHAAHGEATAALAVAESNHETLAAKIDGLEAQTTGSGALSDVDARVAAARTARQAVDDAGKQRAAVAATFAAAERTVTDRQGEVDGIEGRVARAAAEPEPSAAEIDDRIRRIREADAQVDETRQAQSRTERELAGVRTLHDALTRDAARLAEQTAGAPAPDDVDAAVTAIHEIDEEIKRLGRERQDLTDGLERLDRDLKALDGEERECWSRLEDIRGKVLRHAPPAPDREAGLGASWTAMCDWARTVTADLLRRVEASRQKGAAIEERRRDRLAFYRTKVAGHGFEAEADGVSPREAEIGDLLATCRERAKADLDGIRAQRRELRRLETELDGARRRAGVAERLGRLLGARAFQRWRLAGAFERLAAAGSRWLRDLSNDAYSLTHTGQMGFEVVDHGNADERRSVRTLSGGETFLASLSLALALADQVADLASSGAARIESMFLDEGFGSLDPETLDTVAAALEELGSTGRTLGIVTHVPALAERVPLRFRVTKDASTARVERVSS